MDGLPNLLTQEAREAIASGTGSLFEAMITVTLRDNPDLHTREEAIDGLQQLLGPRHIEELLLPVRISCLPCAVKTHDTWRCILETDPYLYVARVGHYRALRKTLSEQFGGIDGILHLRAAHIAEGGDGEAFDRYVIHRYYAILADSNARADQNHPGHPENVDRAPATREQ